MSGDYGLIEIILLTAPLWAILCAIIASSKKRSVGGWAFAGLIFGLLAVILLVLSRPADEQPAAARPKVTRPRTDPFKRG